MTLVDYIKRHRAWSEGNFGPGAMTKRILAHIRKELGEIEAEPTDVYEWADVIILALDGAWRNGHTPEDIARALIQKQELNANRRWVIPPDNDTPIEHVRDSCN